MIPRFSHRLGLLLGAALGLGRPSMAAAATFTVTDFGAVGDGRTLDTRPIQAAIDRCSAAGGGTVVIPVGTFLSGAIFLKRGVSLRVDRGAVLEGSDRLEDYLPEGTPLSQRGVQPWALVNATGLEGTVIDGAGAIDGNGRRWWDEYWRLRNAHDPDLGFKTRRPKLVHLTNCRNVRVSDLTLRNQAVWCLHIQFCTDVTAENLTIRAPHDAPSSDGIDVDSSRRVHIRGCDIDVDDDCISIKAGVAADRSRANRPSEDILIEQCHFGYGHGGVGIGSETFGGIRRVEVRDCIADHGNRAPVRIKTMPSHGGVVEDVVYRRIRVEGADQAFEINMDWRTGTSRPQPESRPPPLFRNIRLIDITGTAKSVGIIAGLSDSPVDGVSFSGCRIESPKPLAVQRARNIDLSGLKQIIQPAASTASPHTP